VSIGIFGGTFDPIHDGHIRVAQSTRETMGLDEVRLIPANIPPHRNAPDVAPEHRLAMVQAATKDYEGLLCDDREMNFLGPSFTMRTLESLCREFPQERLFLILGLDAFLGLPTWYRWRDIPDLTKIIIVNRPGVALPEPLPDWWQWLENGHSSQSAVELVNMAPYDVSATELRLRLKARQSVEGLLHPDVITYIQENGLYV
jgi:nicotinate-nucleotide adenylyltransferase